MSRPSILLPLMLTSAAALCACSGGNSPAPSVPPAKAVAPAPSANEAQAAKEAALYEQMRTSGSWDIALTLGNEVVTKFAGTPAAAQVQQTIAEVRAKGEAQANQKRLARLWTYTATLEAGGTQYAAAIAAKNPLGGNAKVRLVLRRHPKWGQSVYLLLDSAKFDCRKGCATLPVSFDGGAAQRMRATILPTGEPALFIVDGKGFIAKLEKSQTRIMAQPSGPWRQDDGIRGERLRLFCGRRRSQRSSAVQRLRTSITPSPTASRSRRASLSIFVLSARIASVSVS